MLSVIGGATVQALHLTALAVASLLTWCGLLPLDTTAAPVRPVQGSGFAAYIVGGFFGLGILVLFMIWTSRRPKRPS